MKRSSVTRKLEASLKDVTWKNISDFISRHPMIYDNLPGGSHMFYYKKLKFSSLEILGLLSIEEKHFKRNSKNFLDAFKILQMFMFSESYFHANFWHSINAQLICFLEISLNKIKKITMF